MNLTSVVYHPLLKLLKQTQSWVDIRHAQTLCWMVIGLITSESIHLTKWGSYIDSRAMRAQSHQRRYSRWLHNSRINVHRLYKPIIQSALAQWQGEQIILLEDTTQLWNQYCFVRVSVQYRGRAVTLSWRVIQQSSSSVALDRYRQLLSASAKLLPAGVKVVFLADRGFADTKLMRFITDELDWHYRIRVKSNTCFYRHGYGWKQPRDFHLQRGEALLMHNVRLTRTHAYGLVHLALACDPITGERWSVVSDEPTTLQTLAEYGLRFEIEEQFLDEKSNGFQIHQSQIRSLTALSRLCFVIAVASLWLTLQGEQVVRSGLRRRVDAHWSRGSSYLRIGWQWFKAVLFKGWSLFPLTTLSGNPDPHPAFASRTHAEKHFLREFTVRSFSYLTC